MTTEKFSCRLCKKQLSSVQVFGDPGDVLCWDCWRDLIDDYPPASYEIIIERRKLNVWRATLESPYDGA